jgi:hypothetical protein
LTTFTRRQNWIVLRIRAHIARESFARETSPASWALISKKTRSVLLVAEVGSFNSSTVVTDGLDGGFNALDVSGRFCGVVSYVASSTIRRQS